MNTTTTLRKPRWLIRKLPSEGERKKVLATIGAEGLHTVCAEAHCPNQVECFSKGTATFLLLGPYCTRSCSFCAVRKSAPVPPNSEEPFHIAHAVRKLKIGFCVITMVTRDDLADGGAQHIVSTVEILRKECPGIKVELLISDLKGDWESLEKILSCMPEVINHNIETVPRLYSRVRPEADYGRSLELISRAANHAPKLVVKSGLMVGLGEKREEVFGVMKDLRSAGCHLVTIGQYLAPSKNHYPVDRYVRPEEFVEYETYGITLGFSAVASSPFVRSSYRAEKLYEKACQEVFSGQFL